MPIVKEDAQLFFGRETFVDLLLAAVNERPLVGVIGPSGSGKSSVVQAGLMAQLSEEDGWILIRFRPGQHPTLALANAFIPYLIPHVDEGDRLLEAERIQAQLNAGQISLQEIVQAVRAMRAANSRVLLFADQFEELYTLSPNPETRQQFLDILLALIFDQQYRSAPCFTFIFTLRADFLDRLLQYRPLADALQDADIKLGPMTRSELRRAVSLPAELAQTSFEDGLIDRILEDVGEGAGRLPLLAFALEQLWDQQVNRSLTHQAYDSLGGVNGALARHAESIFGKLGETEQAEVKRLFLQLIQPGQGTQDTRRVAKIADLGNDETLLTHLADARLIVTNNRMLQGGTVELVHEALITHWGRLREWIEEARAFRIWQERVRIALDEWVQHEQDDGGLLRGLALSTAENWLQEQPESLNQTEQAYIRASLAHREQLEAQRQAAQANRERLQRRFITALSVGLVAALILSIVALLQWRTVVNERDTARRAEALRLAVQGENALADDLVLAYLLVVEALQRHRSSEIQSSVQVILNYSQQLNRFIRIPVSETVLRGGLAPGGQFGAVGGADGVQVYDLETGLAAGPFIPAPTEAIQPARLAFSPDLRHLALVAEQIEIVEWRTGQRVLMLPNDKEVMHLKYSPDGTLLAAIGLDTLFVFDTASGELLYALNGSFVPEIAFTPDSATLAMISAPGNLLLFDARKGTVEGTTRQELSRVGITSLAISPDGTLAAAGDSQGFLHLWDLADSRSAGSVQATDRQAILSLTFIADGQIIITGSADGRIIFWDTTVLALLNEFFGLKGEVVLLQTSTDESVLVSASLLPDESEHQLELVEWSLAGSGEPTLVERLPGEIMSFANTDNAYYVSREGDFERWSRTSGNTATLSEIDINRLAWTVQLSPDGAMLAESTRAGSINLHDTRTGTLIKQLPGPALPIAGITFSHTNRYLAAGGCGQGRLEPPMCEHAQAWVWDLETDELLGTLLIEEPRTAFNMAAVSADGRFAVGWLIRLIDRGVLDLVVWDVASGTILDRVVTNLPIPEADNRFGLNFAADGRHFSGNTVSGFRVWQITDEGQVVERFSWDHDLVGVVAAFSPDNRFVAAASSDGTIRLWSFTDGILVQEWQSLQSTPLAYLSFTSDSKFLLSVSTDSLLAAESLSNIVSGTSSLEFTIESLCDRVNRNMTTTEWRLYFGDEPYRETCPMAN